MIITKRTENNVSSLIDIKTPIPSFNINQEVKKQETSKIVPSFKPSTLVAMEPSNDVVDKVEDVEEKVEDVSKVIYNSQVITSNPKINDILSKYEKEIINSIQEEPKTIVLNSMGA